MCGGVGRVCLLSYPHAQFDVFASVHLHAGVQKTDLAKVFSINHKGAADHSRSSEWEERENIFETDVTDGMDAIPPRWAGSSTPSVRAWHEQQILVLLRMEATSSLLVTHISDKEFSHHVALGFFLWTMESRRSPPLPGKNYAFFHWCPLRAAFTTTISF